MSPMSKMNLNLKLCSGAAAVTAAVLEMDDAVVLAEAVEGGDAIAPAVEEELE